MKYRVKPKAKRIENLIIACHQHVNVASIARMLGLSYIFVYSILNKHELDVVNKNYHRLHPYKKAS